MEKSGYIKFMSIMLSFIGFILIDYVKSDVIKPAFLYVTLFLFLAFTLSFEYSNFIKNYDSNK